MFRADNYGFSYVQTQGIMHNIVCGLACWTPVHNRKVESYFIETVNV